MKNNERNFGINLENMSCFKGIPPASPSQNRHALNLIRDGIELFEFPQEGLGMPLEMLEQGNSVNILAEYLGLGRLITTKVIPANDGEIGIDSFLSEKPSEIARVLVNFGFGYNGIRIMNKRGFCGFKDRFAERIYALPEDVGHRFVNSLMEARLNHYAATPRQATVEEVVHLIGEIYDTKHGGEYWRDINNGLARRLRTRSHSKGREGRVYITWERRTYSCDCPSRVECRHIKTLKPKI